MNKKNNIGALGEDIACRYLSKRDFEIVERNYEKPQGEVDIIARSPKGLHFVEVKSVSWNFVLQEMGERGIRPEENMHSNKLKRLFRAVQIYLMEYRVPESSKWQMDAVFVYIDQKRKKSKVEYYEHISLE